MERQEQGKSKMARLNGPKAKNLPIPAETISMCYHTWVTRSSSIVFQLCNKHFTKWAIFLGSLAPFFWHSYIICWPNIYLIWLLWFFKLLQTNAWGLEYMMEFHLRETDSICRRTELEITLLNKISQTTLTFLFHIKPRLCRCFCLYMTCESRREPLYEEWQECGWQNKSG